MSGAAILSFFWVLAATVTALLPMRLQFYPGVTLLVLAPALIAWIWVDHGWIWAGLALVAFVSMFRHPLVFLYKRIGKRGDGPVQ